MTIPTRRMFLSKTMAAIAAMVFSAGKASAAGAVEHVVSITGFKFVPETISVSPGDTITWSNEDIVPHTATALDKSWDTGTISKGKSSSLIVGDDFHAGYFCRFHPKMTARVVSQPE